MDPAGRGDGGKMERVVLRHIHYHIKKIVSERMLCNTGSSPELLTTWRGGTWWREISEGGDVMYPYDFIHVVAWKKPIQHYKAIILQLKIKKSQFGQYDS